MKRLSKLECRESCHELKKKVLTINPLHLPQVVVYSSLPFNELELVQEVKAPATLQEIQLRHQQSLEAMRGMENSMVAGLLGKKHGGKRSRLQEFLQKQKAVRLLTKGKWGSLAAAANKAGK